MRSRSLLWIALLLVFAVPPVPADDPALRRVTILHTNDQHGHLLPFPYTEPGRSAREQPSVGGIARRAALARILRSRSRWPVVLVDAGDIFTRGPLTTAYQGQAEASAMNAAGYDLAALGNNEFKARDGADRDDAAGAQAALLAVVRRSRFRWLCANATDARGRLLPGVRPFVVRRLRGLRVGFLGLTAPRSAGYPQTKGWRITDPLAAAKVWIPRARKSCDVLIALTHIGIELDRQLAASTSGLDAIVGGDSHTFLYRAEATVNRGGRKVPIVQAGEFGANLGRLDLAWRRTSGGRWQLYSFRSRLIPVGPAIRPAPDVAAVLAPYVAPFRIRVGMLAEAIASPAERPRQTTRLLCEAMRRATHTDLALHPQGGGLFEVFRRRAVTRYDIYQILPFHNEAVVASLTGAQIEELLRRQPDMIRSGPEEAIDPARAYRACLADYIARDVCSLPGDRLEKTGLDLRKILTLYLQPPRPCTSRSLSRNLAPEKSASTASPGLILAVFLPLIADLQTR
ncbi:MAG: bifunctional metallophosphatase/5'-nucleotidase [Armatimonadetes bacterium]|nr:bifunctional metallophosphatase/5'-nucleotidase [Armatimonadota bacterium]